MERDRLKRLNGQHTLLGIVLGWVLYVVNVSGTFSVIVDELQVWEDPALRAHRPGTVSAQTAVQLAVQNRSLPIDAMTVELPRAGRGIYRVTMSSQRTPETESTSSVTTHISAVDGSEVVPRRGAGVAIWAKNLHRYLLIEPRIAGRVLVGLTGVFMLVLIVNGVLIHQRIRKDLFKMRWTQSVRLKWRDLHNATGLWTLPFSLTITFSGVLLGAVVLFVLLMSALATGGDYEVFMQKAQTRGPEIYHPPSGPSATVADLDHAIAVATSLTHGEPFAVRILNFQRPDMAYRVALRPSILVIAQEVVIDASTSKAMISTDQDQLGGFSKTAALRVFSAMEPLHYGTFGGLWLKAIYLLSGVALSVCIVSGLLIYFERRVKGAVGRYSRDTYLVLGRANAGILTGLPLALGTVFYADLCFQGDGASRWTAINVGFFASWAMSVAYCVVYRNTRRAARQVMAVTAALFFLIPGIAFLKESEGFWSSGTVFVHAVSLSVASGLAGYLALSRHPVARLPIPATS